MPTLMDPVPPPTFRCACPGPKRQPGDVPCIRENTAGDQLCDACRACCHGDAGSGNKVMFIDAFGPAFPFSAPRQEDTDEPEPQRQHRRERVGLTDSIVIDMRKD